MNADNQAVGTRIPFSSAYRAPGDIDLIRESLDAGQLIGDGPRTRDCSVELEGIVGAPRVMLTTSATHALELSALLLDLEPGDEVIVPAFTFPSTAGAFALHGARPVFADICPDTLNIDVSHAAQLITPRTRAIVAMHYAGVACDMHALNRLAADHGLRIIEDNAHGLFGTYDERPLGSFGALAALSFHQTKNLSCGEGGALIVNDTSYIARAEIIREKGTDRARFFRGEVDKYTWRDLGSSYLPSELLAALLLSQIRARRTIQTLRQRIWHRYFNELSDWCRRVDAVLPVVPAHCRQAYHMFYVLMPNGTVRDAFIAFMNERMIGCAFHYQPLHLSPMGMKYGGRAGDCPVTENVSERLVRLPFFPSLSEADQGRVISAVHAFGSSL